MGNQVGLRLLGCVLVLLLGACASRDAPRRAHVTLPPPPPATPEQIDKEKRYLRQHFLTDSCLVQLSQKARTLQPGDPLPGDLIYSVDFPSDSKGGHSRTRRLDVTERKREAWLYTSNAGGWYTVRGPLPLWQCLHDAPLQ